MNNFIHQIFLSDFDDEQLPPYLNMAVSTVTKCFPNAKHKIYRYLALREWIESEYSQEIVKTFDCLLPYAYKSDFGRYLLLYKYGGWYFDIAMRIINPIEISSDLDLLVFAVSSQISGVSYCCSNGIIYSKPQNKIFEAAIEEVIKNVGNQYYGKNALYPTGPVLFGKQIAQFNDDLNIYIGKFQELTPEFPNKNGSFILNDGTLFALAKPKGNGGDLSILGMKGSNNYGTAYAERKIYKPI